MCALGEMLQDDAYGTALVKKATGSSTNADEIVKELGQRCNQGHKHTVLATRAQVYPDELCRAILEYLMQQMRQDVRLQGKQNRSGHVRCVIPSNKWVLENSNENSAARDDVTGKALNPNVVGKAREEEIRKYKQYI